MANGFGHDSRRIQSSRQSRQARGRRRANDSARRRRRRAEHRRVQRQSRRAVGRRGNRELHRGTQARYADGRAARRHALPRDAEQQGRSQGLPGRSHGVGACRSCRASNSPRLKLLYDIYHMQIMDGDVIATIRANAQHIAHFHTGGVPGRAEIDDTQELNYRRVMQAIADTGVHGIRRAGVRAEARSAHVAQAGVRDLRRLNGDPADALVAGGLASRSEGVKQRNSTRHRCSPFSRRQS